MNTMLFPILLLTLIGSVLSLFGGMFLLTKKSWGPNFSLLLTSFAAGVLLSTAFLDLFPEAQHHLEESGNVDVFIPALIGIVFFFLLERSFVWFHHHHEAHGMKPTIWMVTLGDSVHNFIDGVAIAATYMANPAVGLATALAIAAHEIPQEIADFSILLSRGLSKSKTIVFNVISALAAFAGAISMYFFAETLEPYIGFIIAFSAGMFCYIALSDLIPELHHSQKRLDNMKQIVMFLAGIFFVIAASWLFGDAAHAGV